MALHQNMSIEYVQVTTDSARGRRKRVGSTKKSTPLLDDVLALPDHSNDRTRSHVLDKTREEGLALEVLVVLTGSANSWLHCAPTYLLEQVLAGVHHLHGHQLHSGSASCLKAKIGLQRTW